MLLDLKILNQNFFKDYKSQLAIDLSSGLNKLEQSKEDFSFYMANAAVHSSNIEGNTVNFDTLNYAANTFYGTKLNGSAANDSILINAQTQKPS